MSILDIFDRVMLFDDIIEFMISRLKVFSLVIVLSFVLTGSKFISSGNENSFPEGKFDYRVFRNPDKSFGYVIFIGEKEIIRQTTIPGRSGNAGFKKRGDARKIAKFVIKKINAGSFPPTIFEEDLVKYKIE